MSMQKIRDTYWVPAKRGMSVRFSTGRYGVIVGSRDDLLRIRLEGDHIVHDYHPVYAIEYLGKNGSVIWHEDGKS